MCRHLSSQHKHTHNEITLILLDVLHSLAPSTNPIFNLTLKPLSSHFVQSWTICENDQIAVFSEQFYQHVCEFFLFCLIISSVCSSVQLRITVWLKFGKLHVFPYKLCYGLSFGLCLYAVIHVNALQLVCFFLRPLSLTSSEGFTWSLSGHLLTPLHLFRICSI